MALGFAVFLTLVSGATAVYYFEQSGNLNYEVQTESVPALEASWAAARETERLRNLGLGLLAESDSGTQQFQPDTVAESLERLETALSTVSGVPTLEQNAQAVSDSAYDLVEVIDNLALQRLDLSVVNQTADEFQSRLASTVSDVGESQAAVSVLQRALRAEDEIALQGLWDEFASLYATGIDPTVASLGEGEGAFYVRGQQLALLENIGDLAVSLDRRSADLENSVSAMLAASRAHSSEQLDQAVGSFDEGRTLLTAISVISVIAAVIAAWLWVGNGMVRRLSRMSERMRGMAGGDLETPVPEVGRDEIGELANALEVFRSQALEVERLNLVEQLYEELRKTNAELQRMQARLVAQEKLAALGELVSGVAHEISNPLNFVNNFAEGTIDLYSELSEMLESYREKMSTDDMALLDELSQELTMSMNHVLSNGGRALAIVERMRGLGLVGGDPVMTDLNAILRDAVQTGYTAFNAQNRHFLMELEFNLDTSLGETMLVEGDFAEAIVALVSNACFAMHGKEETSGADYQPSLAVSTHLAGDVVEIRIRDNGPGIPDDVVGQIFNPFFSTRDGALGAGLGLPIAADVARRLGGDLSVGTVYGEYAEFTMTVPATAATAPETAQAEQQAG